MSSFSYNGSLTMKINSFWVIKQHIINQILDSNRHFISKSRYSPVKVQNC